MPVQTPVQPRSFSARAITASEALYAIGYLLLKTSMDFSWWVMRSTWQTGQTAEPVGSEKLLADHEKDKQTLLAEFHKKKFAGQIALGGKSTSYLFRPRQQLTTKLDMGHFNKVLTINRADKIAYVGGMTTFYDLVQETLKQGLLPEVVPELRGITVGGSVVGMAIESSSFKYGLVHNSVTEMDVLTGKGELITCCRNNAYSDLFYAMPNSYGTLGYALSLKIKLVDAAPFVKLEYSQFYDVETCFQAIERFCKQPGNCHFVDGAIFSPNFMVITRGTFVQHAPYVSNYRQKGIYYQSMQKRDCDYLSVSDYIWRWDADSFWSTQTNGKPGFLQNSCFRQLFGSMVLRADRLTLLGRLAGEFHANILKFLDAVSGTPTPVSKEKIVQDVGIPIENCADFVRWLDETIGIYPLFVCPVQEPHPEEKYPLWELNRGKLACDIGIFGSRHTQQSAGFFNRQLENKVEELKGTKSLYSTAYFDKPRFERLYGGDAYKGLKSRYDPGERFPTLFEKCVLNR